MPADQRAIWKAASRDDRAEAVEAADAGLRADREELCPLAVVYAERELRQRWLVYAMLLAGIAIAVLLRPWTFESYFILVASPGILILYPTFFYKRLRAAIAANRATQGTD